MLKTPFLTVGLSLTFGENALFAMAFTFSVKVAETDEVGLTWSIGVICLIPFLTVILLLPLL